MIACIEGVILDRQRWMTMNGFSLERGYAAEVVWLRLKGIRFRVIFKYLFLERY